jgi:hypothetical protein
VRKSPQTGFELSEWLKTYVKDSECTQNAYHAPRTFHRMDSEKCTWGRRRQRPRREQPQSKAEEEARWVVKHNVPLTNTRAEGSGCPEARCKQAPPALSSLLLWKPPVTCARAKYKLSPASRESILPSSSRCSSGTAHGGAEFLFASAQHQDAEMRACGERAHAECGAGTMLSRNARCSLASSAMPHQVL